MGRSRDAGSPFPARRCGGVQPFRVIMKAFLCACRRPLFFHNTRCPACGAEVAYDPAARLLGPVADAGDGTLTIANDARTPPPRFRYCEYRTQAALCNWLVAADSAETECLSCRLTRTIPDLSRPKNASRLAELETAKRRVLYGVMSFGIPIVPRSEDTDRGLAFDFLESLPGGPPVLTGHAGGVITLNVAEADNDYRERHRESLNEPYRTIIGHLRHELGHYYWDRLIGGTEWLPKFRALFGDERADYATALKNHYRNGPPADWPHRYISSYAAAHPWEDWAEIWAHCLHIGSTLQTLGNYDLDISHVRLPITPYGPDALYDPDPLDEGNAFLAWINAWLVLTGVLNETSRSMGQPEIYPFAMNRSVVTKMHFVQCVIRQYDEGRISAPPPSLMIA